MAKNVKLLLLVPALWTSIFDIILTVIHQSKEYWDGDLTKANEGNPIGALLMKNHVSGLFVISGLWIIAIGILGYFLPRQASKIFLLFCVIAHSFGASTWLSTRYGFWYVITFILFNSILYCVVDNITHRQKV
ncbi:MAG: hypothetical protein KF763_16310 [Cyclobacteriaceae bacterium]|nr:hypothetical protein [Cyclobacteriaceae bacterium]